MDPYEVADLAINAATRLDVIVLQHMASDLASGRFELASEALFLFHALFWLLVTLAITFDRRLRSTTFS